MTGLAATCAFGFIISHYAAAIAQNLPVKIPGQEAALSAPVAPQRAPVPPPAPAPAPVQAPAVAAALVSPVPSTASSASKLPLPEIPTKPVPTSTSSKTIGLSPQDILAGIIEDYTYNPASKRDPFLPYESIAPVGDGGSMLGPLFPLQRFDIDQLKLVGVIWDVKNPKAMILDPSGTGYVVRVNERIGRNSGYIARIRESELVIVETFKGSDGNVSYTTKLMKLANQ